jgi:uncharacterized cupredoxin-like copper-binding protein
MIFSKIKPLAWLTGTFVALLTLLVCLLFNSVTVSPATAGEQAIFDSKVVVLVCGINSDAEARASTLYPKNEYDLKGTLTFKKTCGGQKGKLVTAKNNTSKDLKIRFGFFTTQDESLDKDKEKTFIIRNLTRAGIRIRAYSR